MFEAVRKSYVSWIRNGYSNLNYFTQFNFGHSNVFNYYIIGYLILKNVFIGSTAKNGFQIRIVQQKIHNIKTTLFYMTLKENITENFNSKLFINRKKHQILG